MGRNVSIQERKTRVNLLRNLRVPEMKAGEIAGWASEKFLIAYYILSKGV